MLELLNNDDSYLLSMRDQAGEPFRLMVHRDDLMQLVNEFTSLELQRLVKKTAEAVKKPEHQKKGIT